jgi:Domain of unknown function (DUF222)
VCRGKGIPGMSVLAERLVASVAMLAAGLPAGDDLEQALRQVPEGDLLRLLKQTGSSRRLVDALASRVAGELERREDILDETEPLHSRMGERTLTDVVAREAGMSYSAAQQWCTVGEAVTSRISLLGQTLPPPRPRIGAALDEGELTVEAAAIISRALTGLEDHSSLDERDLAEGLLVQEAQVLTLRQLGRLCTQLRDRFDPDGIEPREDLLRRRAGLRRIQKPDGSVQYIIDADPESDGLLKAAIDARTAPRRQVRFGDPDDPAADPATADDRTLRQRQLAALVGMARESLANDDGELAGMPVTMLVTVPLETLTTGTGAAFIAGIDTPISAATARRLACQANIIPIVLGGDSEILDVGRAKRLFTRGQRLAMAARDRGCTWPGCEAPPGWCEAAHRNPWHAGGKTRLDDGILLCPYHHHRLDNDGWAFEIRNGVPYFIPPPHVDPTGTPRRGGRERLPENLAG